MRIAIGPGWGSHLPVTMELLRQTSGPVVELGCGIYSTPVIHWACQAAQRQVTSYESDGRWRERFHRFNRGHHRIIQVESWKELDLSEPVSLALVDHTGAGKRHRQAIRLAHADFVIVHDADRSMAGRYRRSKLRNVFKYRRCYHRVHPATLVLSNTVDPQEVLGLEMEAVE